jgi:hypothetical protein
MAPTPPSVTFEIEDGKGKREQHQLPGPGGTVRVASGRPGRRSGVWRIWANPSTSDIYIAARPIAGVEKVSLHQTGDWRVQWVIDREPGRRMAEQTGSRILDQWQRPPESAPGWTKGLSIWVPDGLAWLRPPESTR